MLKSEDLTLSGVRLVTPTRHGDDRGFFSEVYNKKALAEIGIEDDFVQDNHSLSRDTGTVRGLHFQVHPHAIAKLVRVSSGSVFDVVVDLRQGSPTYGDHVSAVLSSENWAQIYVPVGFAHGFCTLEPDTEVIYKVTDHWFPAQDKGVAWDDPALGIEWPVGPERAILSEKDRSQPALADLDGYFEWNEV